MSNWFSEPMKDEVPYEEIQKKADNGDFHFWKYTPSFFDFQSNGYEDVVEKLKTYTADKYIALGDDKEAQEKMVDEVLAIYRSVDLFPIQYYSETGILNEIEKCINYKAKFDGDTISCGAGVGTGLCRYLFPNLFDTPSKHDLEKKGAETMYAKFHNDDYLRRAIKFCFSYKNGCPVPTSVEGGLRLVGSAPSNFRPMNAKAVYERFCPEGGTIYDFCCVDDETEFFNGKEWKSLADYVEGDKVLQYNEDGTAELVEPIEYIKYKSDAPFYLYETKNLNMALTGNHDVVLRSIKTGELKKRKQEDILGKNISAYTIPKTFVYSNEEGYSCNNLDLLKLALGTVFLSKVKDGKYVFNGYHKRVATTMLMKELVISLGINHTIKGSLLIYECREDLVDTIKNLFSEIWYTADEESKVTFIKAINDWRGYSLTGLSSDNKIFSSKFSFGFTDKKMADVLQFIFTSTEDKSVNIIEKNNVYYVYIFGVFLNCAKYLGNSNGYKEIYKEDKYCFVVPSHMLVLRRKDIIFVTGNCGFGGRLLGALSSKKNFRYVGTDPNTETMYHLHELGNYIEQVTDREDSFELHCCGSEEFRGKPNSIDFAFSSPPYFDLEVYSDEETQCFNKFPVLEDWLEGYVRETIKNIKYMLKPGRKYAVNIADFKVGNGGECAYVDEWIRISTEEGMPLYDTVYLGVTARAGSAEQAAGELKKENILIFEKPL